MTAVQLTLAAVAVALLLLFIGWQFGVKTAFATLTQVAQQKLDDSDYTTFMILLAKVKE